MSDFKLGTGDPPVLAMRIIALRGILDDYKRLLRYCDNDALIAHAAWNRNYKELTAILSKNLQRALEAPRIRKKRK